MNPNRLSEPTFRNARRSKSSYIRASMVEDKCLRVKDGPQDILKRLTPGGLPTAARLNGCDHLRDFALVRRVYQRRHEQPPRDFFVGQRRIGKPVVERAIFPCDLFLNGLP